jgi:hypothetical protein
MTHEEEFLNSNKEEVFSINKKLNKEEKSQFKILLKYIVEGYALFLKEIKTEIFCSKCMLKELVKCAFRKDEAIMDFSSIESAENNSEVFLICVKEFLHLSKLCEYVKKNGLGFLQSEITTHVPLYAPEYIKDEESYNQILSLKFFHLYINTLMSCYTKKLLDIICESMYNLGSEVSNVVSVMTYIISMLSQHYERVLILTDETKKECIITIKKFNIEEISKNDLCDPMSIIYNYSFDRRNNE